MCCSHSDVMNVLYLRATVVYYNGKKEDCLVSRCSRKNQILVDRALAAMGACLCDLHIANVLLSSI